MWREKTFGYLRGYRLFAREDYFALNIEVFVGRSCRAVISGRRKVVNPEFGCPRFLGCGLAVEEEHVRLDSLGVDLNSLGAKNETGRPKAERAGANESRYRRANVAKCERRLV